MVEANIYIAKEDIMENMAKKTRILTTVLHLDSNGKIAIPNHIRKCMELRPQEILRVTLEKMDIEEKS